VQALACASRTAPARRCCACALSGWVASTAWPRPVARR